ncbi:endocuticle structural glycoprotein SgAbd-2-like isoform X1 [Diabrotica undecimpunctata]|uniref:endocuticle structural glycoprotein SgAbd-2-like isoform X1 n=1 Tax=Diabrotica undecimpunctata TaxID=50387 RepID=UPI003B63D992
MVIPLSRCASPINAIVLFSDTRVVRVQFNNKMKLLILLTVGIPFVLSQGRGRPPIPLSSGSSPDGNARIISGDADVNTDGSYKWSFQSDNGISAQEVGQTKNANSQEPIEEAQGNFQYTAPDGSPIQVSYIANENGFQPNGAHLPVAPPIPIEILRSLEWNAAHPEEDDDGSGKPRRP